MKNIKNKKLLQTILYTPSFFIIASVLLNNSDSYPPQVWTAYAITFAVLGALGFVVLIQCKCYDTLEKVAKEYNSVLMAPGVVVAGLLNYMNNDLSTLVIILTISYLVFYFLTKWYINNRLNINDDT